MENYTIAWLMYLVGALGLTAVILRLAWRLKREWRYLLLASVIGLLFTPAVIDSEQGLWAPAVLIFVLDGAFKAGTDATPVGLILLMGCLLALLVSTAVLLIWRRADTPPSES